MISFSFLLRWSSIGQMDQNQKSVTDSLLNFGILARHVPQSCCSHAAALSRTQPHTTAVGRLLLCFNRSSLPHMSSFCPQDLPSRLLLGYYGSLRVNFIPSSAWSGHPQPSPQSGNRLCHVHSRALGVHSATRDNTAEEKATLFRLNRIYVTTHAVLGEQQFLLASQLMGWNLFGTGKNGRREQQLRYVEPVIIESYAS